jgi:hypothetical protein
MPFKLVRLRWDTGTLLLEGTEGGIFREGNEVMDNEPDRIPELGRLQLSEL